MPEKIFPGFPEKTEVIPVPVLFFTSVLPIINDVAALKVILYIFNLLSKRRGYPKYVSYSELSGDSTLREILGNDTVPFDDSLRSALAIAVRQNILLKHRLGKDGSSEEIYLINGAAERKAIEKITSGEIKLEHFDLVKPVKEPPSKMTNIFSLYEQNIGILTPIIAEQLREAEKTYPADWIENAFKEAVTINKRNWKYISRILERWLAEGKDDGKAGRSSKKENDPDRYIKGKYGHMVGR